MDQGSALQEGLGKLLLEFLLLLEDFGQLLHIFPERFALFVVLFQLPV